MAFANARLIHALRTTASRLREGAPYQWGHHGMCNCGQLAQTITQRSRREIHEAALTRGGEWRDRAQDYCPTSGLPLDGIIGELFEHGLNGSDLADLEYLGDDAVLRRVIAEGGPRELRRNERDHVVLYVETWATMLDEQLAAREAAAEAVA